MGVRFPFCICKPTKPPTEPMVPSKKEKSRHPHSSNLFVQGAGGLAARPSQLLPNQHAPGGTHLAACTKWEGSKGFLVS